ncbi:MAG: PQQ-binding-like beta-propeller repeat protein, partial [Bradymonadaceae bacterium]|nr:PQQ-binding-like beta-propeller repeat protein [Lujinxingiaceae bacterium]
GTAGFVARYSNNGTLRWANGLRGSGDERVVGVTVGHQGGIFAVGDFDGTLVFGPDATSTPVLTNFEGFADAFLASFSADGDYAWVKHLSSTNNVQFTAVATAHDGGAIGVGNFTSSLVFEDSDHKTLTGEVGTDGFVGHWSADGALKWAVPLTSAQSVEVNAVAVMPDGRIAVVGAFQDELSIGDKSIKLKTANPAQIEGFLLVFNADGKLAPTRQFKGSNGVNASAVAVLDNGWLAVAGTYNGDLVAPELASVSPQADIFVTAIDLSMPPNAFEWSKAIGGSGIRTVDAIAGRHIDSHPYDYEGRDYSDDTGTAGELSISGTFGGTVAFGAGESNVSLLRSPTATARSVYVARFHNDGRLKWARLARTNSRADAPKTAIASTAAGSLVVVGELAGGAPPAFWSGSASPIRLSNTVSGDGFIAHLRRSNSPCVDMTGLQEGASWPMAGYCPTRRGMTPFVGPGRATLRDHWMSIGGLDVVGEPVVDMLGNTYVTTKDGRVHRISNSGVLDDNDWPFKSWTDNNEINYCPTATTGSAPLIASDGSIFHAVGAICSGESHTTGLVAIGPDARYRGFHSTGGNSNAIFGSPIAGAGAHAIFTTSGSQDSLHWLAFNGSALSSTLVQTVQAGTSVTLGSQGRLHVVLKDGGADSKLVVFEQAGNIPCTIGLAGIVTADPVVGLDDTVYVSNESGRLYALDPYACKIIWHRTVSGKIARVAIDGEGILYFGTSDFDLYAIDPTSPVAPPVPALNSTKLAAGTTFPSAAVIDGHGNVYIVSGSGQVYHIDVNASSTYSSLVIPLAMGVTQAPAIDRDGHLIVGGNSGVRAFK